MTEKLTPSLDDILRARLKTLGVTEYRFTPETSEFLNVCLCHAAHKSAGGFLAAPSTEWWIYDVGGQRSLVSIVLI